MIATFILLYGLGSGALAVARATIPLVFYENVEFAKANYRDRVAAQSHLRQLRRQFWLACCRISAATPCLVSACYARARLC